MNIGYGFGDAPTNVNSNAVESSTVLSSSDAPAPTASNLNGVLGGVQGGYNYQFDANLVAGVETDLAYSGASRSSSAIGGVSIPGVITGRAQTTVKEKLDELGTLRARLGFLPKNMLALVLLHDAYAAPMQSTSSADGTKASNPNILPQGQAILDYLSALSKSRNHPIISGQWVSGPISWP